MSALTKQPIMVIKWEKFSYFRNSVLTVKLSLSLETRSPGEVCNMQFLFFQTNRTIVLWLFETTLNGWFWFGGFLHCCVGLNELLAVVYSFSHFWLFDRTKNSLPNDSKINVPFRDNQIGLCANTTWRYAELYTRLTVLVSEMQIPLLLTSGTTITE
jgi:hypothetical protein